MEKNKLNEIGDKVVASEFFQRFAYKNTWTSGCCTEVYPVTVNMVNNTIAIQLDGRKTLRGVKQAFDKLVKQIGTDLVKNHYICKYDGSCPNVARILFN